MTRRGGCDCMSGPEMILVVKAVLRLQIPAALCSASGLAVGFI